MAYTGWPHSTHLNGPGQPIRRPANANRCAKANREVEFDQTVPGLRGHTDMLWSEIGDLRAFRFDAELLKALAEQHRDAINGTRSAGRPAER